MKNFLRFEKQDSCSVVLESDLINILETNLLLFAGIIIPTGHRDKAVTESTLNVKMGQRAKPELTGGK